MKVRKPVLPILVHVLLLWTTVAKAQEEKVGFYNTVYLSFAAGSNNADEVTLGAGLHDLFGYRWSLSFGAGIGVGVDNYARLGETLYPVFAEIRHYLPSKSLRKFYLTMAGGHAFTFRQKNSDIIDAEGGRMLNPSVGFRTFSRDGTNVHFDLGVKFQNARFTREQANGDLEFKKIQYRRIVLRIGLTIW
jgi:hypothetical protein